MVENPENDPKTGRFSASFRVDACRRFQSLKSSPLDRYKQRRLIKIRLLFYLSRHSQDDQEGNWKENGDAGP